MGLSSTFVFLKRAARRSATATWSFATDPKYRAITVLKWRDPPRLHQTSVVTWMNRYPDIFRAARAYFADRTDLRILSYGCSTGEEVLTLRQYFPRATITGADINPHNLAQCRKLPVDNRVRFVYSDAAALAPFAPFDAVFCMAVLQRTPHAVEELGLTSLRDVYPFAKFSRQVDELDAMVAPGGLLILHHSQYQFSDTTAAVRYEAVDTPVPGADDGPKFDRASERIPHPVPSGSIFKKRT